MKLSEEELEELIGCFVEQRRARTSELRARFYCLGLAHTPIGPGTLTRAGRISANLALELKKTLCESKLGLQMYRAAEENYRQAEAAEVRLGYLEMPTKGGDDG